MIKISINTQPIYLQLPETLFENFQCSNKNFARVKSLPDQSSQSYFWNYYLKINIGLHGPLASWKEFNQIIVVMTLIQIIFTIKMTKNINI